MYSLAAAAAAQAAVKPQRSPPRKIPIKKRNSSTSSKSKSSPPVVCVDYELLGITPILKRGDTPSVTEIEISKRSSFDSSSRSIAASESARSLRREQSVSFSKVEIREYVMQLGGAPFCDGPPICLSNKLQNECVIDALKFDEMRCRDRRGGLKCVRLSAPERSLL
jgi:hypothetical protein